MCVSLLRRPLRKAVRRRPCCGAMAGEAWADGVEEEEEAATAPEAKPEAAAESKAAPAAGEAEEAAGEAPPPPPGFEAVEAGTHAEENAEAEEVAARPANPFITAPIALFVAAVVLRRFPDEGSKVPDCIIIIFIIITIIIIITGTILLSFFISLCRVLCSSPRTTFCTPVAPCADSSPLHYRSTRKSLPWKACLLPAANCLGPRGRLPTAPPSFSRLCPSGS